MSNFTKLQNDPLVEAVTEILSEDNVVGWNIENIIVVPADADKKEFAAKIEVGEKFGHQTKTLIVGRDRLGEDGKWNFEFSNPATMAFFTKWFKMVPGYEKHIPANRSHPVTIQQIHSLFA